MKKLIIGTLIAVTSSVGLAKEATPGTADSFREINPYKTPIVTNAEAAVWAALKPSPTDVVTVETPTSYNGYIMCNPQRMNIITNNCYDLMDYDDGIICYSKGDYRTWEIYFGPEYRPLILEPKEHCITLRFDNGLVANGSTNDILITKVPAIIKSTQLLDKQIWVTIDYPVFQYSKIVPVSITKSDAVVTITGTNLVKVTKVSNKPESRKVEYIKVGTTTTNSVEFVVSTNYTDWVYSNTTNYNFTFKSLNTGDPTTWCYQIPDEVPLTWYTTGNENKHAQEITVTKDALTFTAKRTVKDIDLVNDTLGTSLAVGNVYRFFLTTEKSEYWTEYETKTIDLNLPTVMARVVFRDDQEAKEAVVIPEEKKEEEVGFFQKIINFFSF